ncbi:MAG: hypothetical protein IT174_12255 [Acidobacteria bacterium]|nr:hypothetical protein [Acidobacteriota bacterium]
MDYMPLTQTLTGGLLALTGAFGATWFTQWLRKRTERKNIESAFYGEISSLLRIIELRGYISALEQDLEDMQSSPTLTSFTHFKVTKSYFRVYENNVGKIGLLTEPLPEKIISFYTLVFSALEDIDEMNEADFSGSNSDVKGTIEELLQIAREVRSVGNEILSTIKNEPNANPNNLLNSTKDEKA